jgi:hypothetical protein
MPRSIRFALLAVLVAAALTPVARAEQRPRITSRGTVDAVIDGVHVTMEYGRPTKRGREIWGALVPWGRWWMPGADETTSIVTDGPLLVASLAMPAGTHTLYTLPTAETFTLIVNNQTGQFHTVYHPERDLGRVPMLLTTLDEPVEQMTFAVTPNHAGGGTLALRWDDREYAARLRAPGLD